MSIFIVKNENIMKKMILILLFYLIFGITYSQNNDIIIASLGGYCSGSVTIKEITDSPQIELNSDKPEVTVSRIGFFSNNEQNFVEYWSKERQLNSQMLGRISTLNSGDRIYFYVFVNVEDSTILLHPLELKISASKKKSCSCYTFGLASIKGVTNGELSKKELLDEGTLTIGAGDEKIELISYKVTGSVKGRREEIKCQGREFTASVKRLIRALRKSQNLYFSEIRVLVGGKCFFMNSIEIKIG